MLVTPPIYIDSLVGVTPPIYIPSILAHRRWGRGWGGGGDGWRRGGDGCRCRAEGGARGVCRTLDVYTRVESSGYPVQILSAPPPCFSIVFRSWPGLPWRHDGAVRCDNADETEVNLARESVTEAVHIRSGPRGWSLVTRLPPPPPRIFPMPRTACIRRLVINTSMDNLWSDLALFKGTSL